MGLHAEDLPGFEWMNSDQIIATSSDKEWRDYYEGKCRKYFREVEVLRAEKAGLSKRNEQLQGIVWQIEDELIVNWIDVKNNDYRKAIHDLVMFNIQIENDPSVSLTAKHRQDEISDLWAQIEYLKNGLEKKNDAL